MNEVELQHSLYTLNEAECFYRSYQEKKNDPVLFKEFIQNLDVDECLRRHYVIPEIKETMPPSMKDEYFYSESEAGMVIQKHNCYSPAFEHFHTYFEGFYVYEGTCEHETNGIRKTLKMGDFCIIPPGVSHQISVQSQSIVIVMILSSQVIENTFRNPTYYKNNLLSEFFLKNMRYAGGNDSLLFHTGNDQELKNLLLQMMLESINKYQEYDAVLTALFSLFFAKLLRYYEHTAESAESSDRSNMIAYELITFIQENHTDITLQKVAAHYHYTPEYTSRFIHEMTGRTFSDILADARMKHAVSLLKSTTLPVSEVGYQVGYVNTENFIRAFRKRYSMTPSQYRRSTAANIV
ncbi:MAG: helix-turn-helix domain-containing protein [Solobacterium sp.]|nr:helix-turn-helix domain-containing protein [Solobacterium sp.]